MDEAVSKALEFSNLTTTLNTQKRILAEKYQEDLVLFHSGKKFTVTRELISFVGTLQSNEIDQTVLLDDNGAPFLVENVNEFMKLLLTTYGTATNTYLEKYSELIKKRNVEGLVNV